MTNEDLRSKIEALADEWEAEFNATRDARIGAKAAARFVEVVMSEALARMFDAAPRDWWRFVPCGACNAPRQEPCQATDGPARGPHAARRRSANVLHGTLWLIANGYEADVLGSDG